MTVVIADVRVQLNEISTTLVSDTVIQQQIDIATRYVENIKSKDATAQQVDDAVLTYAAYLTYVAYIEMVSRDLGRTPEGSDIEMRRLKEIADQTIAIIAPARDVSIPVSKMTTPITEWNG